MSPFPIISPQTLTIETVAVDGVVLGNIGFLQDAIAIALSLTTISSFLNVPDMQNKGEIELQCQLNLGRKDKALHLLFSIAPAYKDGVLAVCVHNMKHIKSLPCRVIKPTFSYSNNSWLLKELLQLPQPCRRQQSCVLGVAANCKVDFLVTRDLLHKLATEPPILWVMQIGNYTTNCSTLNALSISKQ